jgi:KDO2-lipid IV(A) lauroyltransferase
MKKLRYLAEAAFLGVLLTIFRVLPLDAASGLGGFIMRRIGPHMGASRKARRNLERALPELDATAREQIIRGMWDNLGRTAAELPHLQEIARDRLEIINPEILERLRDDGIGAVLFSGHCANWETMISLIHDRMGMPFAAVYRTPNNPYSAAMMAKMRDPDGSMAHLPKSRTGTRAMVKALKDGVHIGLLIDQKYNEGHEAPFFSRPAMTSSAFAEMGVRFDVPVVPVRIERLGGAHFRFTFHEPLVLKDESGAPLPPLAMIARGHACLEDWIRARPEQWLWLHRRWIEDKHDK